MLKKIATKCIRAFKADRQLRIGVIGIVCLLLIIIFAPVIATHDPYSFDYVRLLPPGTDGHILGTNHMGQDVFSMLVYGVGTSLKVAVISAFISGALGVIIGGISGYIGGVTDTVI